MRAAPPVHMLCGTDVRWTLAVGLLTALAAATGTGWAVGRMEGSLLLCAAMASVAGSAAALTVAGVARLSAERRLHWDGRTWLLDGVPGRVDVMIDLGVWMLLRFEVTTQAEGAAARAGGRPWLPLSLGRAGSAPHLCRAALIAEGGRQPGPGA